MPNGAAARAKPLSPPKGAFSRPLSLPRLLSLPLRSPPPLLGLLPLPLISPPPLRPRLLRPSPPPPPRGDRRPPEVRVEFFSEDCSDPRRCAVWLGELAAKHRRAGGSTERSRPSRCSQPAPGFANVTATTPSAILSLRLSASSHAASMPGSEVNFPPTCTGANDRRIADRQQQQRAARAHARRDGAMHCRVISLWFSGSIPVWLTP